MRSKTLPIGVNVLVVSAWEPELTRFRELGRSLLSSINSGTVSIAVQGKTVGIGLVDAALGISRCLTESRPSHVVFLGTGGVITNKTNKTNLSVNEVIVARSVRLIDAAIAEGRADRVGDDAPVMLDESLHDAFIGAGARDATIANTLGITTDDALAATLASFGDVEHLEAFAVARACEIAKIPCAIVLGIANTVGSNGRAEWRANHESASARAAEIAIDVIGKMHGT